MKLIRDVIGQPGWSRLATLLLWMGGMNSPLSAEEKPVDYSGEIRPILSDNCFACHGPDEEARTADLRLDQKESAFEDRGGYAAIVPSDPELSEILYRITSDDPLDVMPPPETNKSLTREQVDLIRRWIAQGAEWEEHWAFVPPSRPEPPNIAEGDDTNSPIDRFIRARLNEVGLQPNPEADPETLIRRVTLDLTGIPPTPEEVDAYLEDQRPDAYERVVDRLLSSPRSGEHLSKAWLDAARYGDTHGLHLDNYREMWPYRDWVVQAINRGLPYDEFVTEQLAGDLLPDPTLDQLVATGFNRAHVTTSEGGSIKEEVYIRNVIERVDATGTVFLGLTVGCARCHDHKFDPITARDYYSMSAFFNSLDGNPLDGNAAQHPPVVRVPSDQQAESLASIDQELQELRTRIKETITQIDYDPSKEVKTGTYAVREDFDWIDDQLPEGAKVVVQGGSNTTDWPFVESPEAPVLSGEHAHGQTIEAQGQHVFAEATETLRIGEGDTLYAFVFIDPLNPPKEIMLQWNSGTWKHRAYWGENLIEFGKDKTTERVAQGPLPTTGEWVRLEIPASEVGLQPGTVVSGIAFTQFGGTVYWDRAGLRTWTPQQGKEYSSLGIWVRDQRILGDEATIPAPIKTIIGQEAEDRTPDQSQQLRDYFVEHIYQPARAIMEPLIADRTAVEAKRKALMNEIPTTLVWKELKEPKPAHILTRGEYDQKGVEVDRAVPSFLPAMPEGASQDRLGLAAWLTEPNHPLTARVAVNRLWQQFFGLGLVKTSEDFGSQGEPPSHPKLLDWLAVQFVEDDWDTKRMIRKLVTSAAYRRSSLVGSDDLAVDPANRLYARGPRFRLDAERLRDQALFVSGLLVERVGGEPVKPPQPSGLWKAVGYSSSNTAQFKADTGPDRVHRRSLYTFWKRTAPPPQMTTFDAPSREACVMRRERTNTPLQALLLLNDPQFVEAARSLASRTLEEAGPSTEERVTRMFRLATGRTPKSIEVEVLSQTFRDLLDAYNDEPDAAAQLLEVGEVPVGSAVDPSVLAAWTMIANTLLNMDEVITRN